METETAPNILCECVALADLRFHPLDKYFIDLSNYDKIPLCKILYSLEVQYYRWNKVDGDAK
jgi:hypothetical protein